MDRRRERSDSARQILGPLPDLVSTVGNTPLIELGRSGYGRPGRLSAKLGMRNPAGSVKDRLAVALIDDAERRGALDPRTTIVAATGGTITGVGEVLKRRRPSVRVVAVEPDGAALLSGRPSGQHQIPGIGVGFIPAVLNTSIIDEVVAVSDEDAFDAARRLAREEGIIAGASSGAAMHAAHAIAARPDSTDKLIVVLLADTGGRYVTTALFG